MRRNQKVFHLLIHGFLKIKLKYFEILSKVTSLFYKATKIEYTGKPLKTEKIVKTDIVIMAAIVIIYAIIAYVNLGSLKNPQTFYQPESPNETVQIDLGSVQSIDTVTYYLGIGDVATKPGMKLSYSKDGRTWQDMNVNCQLNSVFKWEVSKLASPVEARYIKGETSAIDYRMFELAFLAG